MRKQSSLLLTLLVALLMGCGGGVPPIPPTPVSNQRTGCYAPGMTPTSNEQCGILSSFGDPVVDAAFSSEVGIQASFWQGIPAFLHAWDDCQSPNAVSLPTADILFGTNFFRVLIAKSPGNGLPIAGVLAHEWAHQIQFDNGWMVQTEPTVRPTELEADAFSGFYMALAKGWAWSLINGYFSTLASLGDYNFTDPGHHGTPEERLAAANLGFNTGIAVLQSGQPLSYAQLHEIFSSSIRSFDTKALPAAHSKDKDVEAVLLILQKSEVVNILTRRTTGAESVPPPVSDRESLFPRP
jgi:hypothetical protein